MVIEEGSSPLTRGKHGQPVVDLIINGLIPAHAGKTQSSSAWSGRAWAHPRSRGENVFKGGADQMKAGSSPLTRGKLAVGIIAFGIGGLIPAHAGKTTPKTKPPQLKRAHPRSRGENVFQVMRIWPRSGSSPLTRGKLPGVQSFFDLAGLIPAHAGKTYRTR